jgi:hypothetical protein
MNPDEFDMHNDPSIMQVVNDNIDRYTIDYNGFKTKLLCVGHLQPNVIVNTTDLLYYIDLRHVVNELFVKTRFGRDRISFYPIEHRFNKCFIESCLLMNIDNIVSQTITLMCNKIEYKNRGVASWLNETFGYGFCDKFYDDYTGFINEHREFLVSLNNSIHDTFSQFSEMTPLGWANESDDYTFIFKQN